MDSVITPEPHLLPGYTGQCPQFRFREGKTYGKLTHKLLIDPCVNHAPELIVTPPSKKSPIMDYPTPEKIDMLNRREQFVDATYRHPIVPGYDGFVPNLSSKVGKRFLAAATEGLAQHEAIMERMRCEHRNLLHLDILTSGYGLFEHKVGERLMPMTLYRAPLIPVRTRAQAMKLVDYQYKQEKLPYSKFTVPHFMEKDDTDKYIVNGYGGHIPMAVTRYGESNKQLTHSALCDFSDHLHYRKRVDWCPREIPGSSTYCPNRFQFEIYHQLVGMVPKYAGHVPGEAFTFGQTFGNATIDAKNWLAIHKDVNNS